jgi:hypothetical protein
MRRDEARCGGTRVGGDGEGAPHLRGDVGSAADGSAPREHAITISCPQPARRVARVCLEREQHFGVVRQRPADVCEEGSLARLRRRHKVAHLPRGTRAQSWCVTKRGRRSCRWVRMPRHVAQGPRAGGVVHTALGEFLGCATVWQEGPGLVGRTPSAIHSRLWTSIAAGSTCCSG